MEPAIGKAVSGRYRGVIRSVVSILLAFILTAGSCASAQEWAKKMFKTTKHDFGTVARGSKQEFKFKFTNIYKEDIHIASVRSTCGCTTPKVPKDLVKTWEKGEVVSVLNTNSFLGAKAATITVVIDRPYYAEVQLTIKTYIRSDVVFTPGVVKFGAVDAAEGTETSINVAYAGRDDWKIVDVRSANQFFEVELKENHRGSGRVNYKMTVRLKPGAPEGYVQDPLLIVTDDSKIKSLSLPVEGRVVSPLTVSPASLFLGILKPGETAKKRLVVRGNKPFRILAVKCDDVSFEFEEPADGSKTLHFVPIEYTAGDDVGKVMRKIEIETDLGDHLCAECTATATVTESE